MYTTVSQEGQVDTEKDSAFIIFIFIIARLVTRHMSIAMKLYELQARRVFLGGHPAKC